ncbi:benzoate 4-monooxygenase cytochrome P450 [Apiospora phragmitis]|uniref:Benzoate 4-monooxygenase cytochrome P450 n=1 Tax=Apiospora phragmitis TaxID=2905665 RepID=A0ABR1VEI5_9PEZI
MALTGSMQLDHMVQYAQNMSWGSTSAHLGLLLAATLFLVSARRRYLSPISHIPGPFLASFSRLWHLRQIWSGKQNLKLIEQHDRHGHFVRMAHNEVSGQWYAMVAFPDYRFYTPFSLLDPKDKNECSKYLSGGYLMHNVLKSEPAMDTSMRKFFGWMNRFADEKRPMNLDEFFTFVAFDITGEDVNHSIAMNLAMEAYIAFVGYMQWLHGLFANPLVTWLGILPMGHLFDTTMSALAERRKNPDARADLAAHWFRGLEKAEQDGSTLFNLRCLQSFATANVGAGSDTVSAGLQSFVYHLLRHPTGWKRIADEIAEAQKQGRCQNDIISYEDATQLPYLQAAIKEGLRAFAPITMGLPRVAPKGGVTIGDTFFPEGVTLNVSPSIIHTSKEIWGPDAREFSPDRWLEPDAAAKEKYFIPWGVGYASCPGQHVARMQLSKIGATIVRDYEIRQVVPGGVEVVGLVHCCTPQLAGLHYQAKNAVRQVEKCSY